MTQRKSSDDADVDDDVSRAGTRRGRPSIGAIDDWDLPDEVHLITASESSGVPLPEVENQHRNDLLAADIAETLAPLRDASGVHHVPFCSYQLIATAG